MSSRERTVGRIAAITGLTVRALHHYDAIGLVSPTCRSAAGYRLYGEDDLRRLQQVLVLRELGFGLEAVRELLDAPVARRREALLAQRATLERQRAHTDAVLGAIDATLHSLDASTPMNIDTLFEGHDRFRNGEYAQEAERRWGDTDAWKISRKRTARYTKEDWAKIRADSDAITDQWLAAMQQGDAADGARATALAERHREHIERWFYPCSHAMHTQVAVMYTGDERFRAHYDDRADGLAAYVQAAVNANAAAHG